MSREALKQALEALELIRHHGDTKPTEAAEKAIAAITAIKEALAQPDHIVSLTDKGDAPKIGCVQHDCDECQQLPEQMARLGWQCFECPACGSEGARAFPKPEEQQSCDKQKPVAEIVNKFGDPKAFAERELRTLMDIQKLPIGAKLFTSPPQHQPLKRATIADAPDCLNTNDKAMWVIGWNECVEAHGIGDKT